MPDTLLPHPSLPRSRGREGWGGRTKTDPARFEVGQERTLFDRRGNEDRPR
jgi:hypothetical protein